MTKQQFVESFEAQVQLELDKMNVEGDASEAFQCAAVAKLFFEYLKDAEIGLLDFEPCSYYAESSQAQGEVSINGYYLSEDKSELHLFTVVKAAVVGAKVASADIRSASDKAFRFYKRSVADIDTPFYKELDEALAPHAAAMAIYNAMTYITSVNVYVFTDGECERITIKEKDIDGLSLKPHFWDIERLHKQMISGSEREEILIDFNEEHGGPLPAMRMVESNGGYVCYVGYLSGDILADMYAKHSSRLIEQNVRMYLQARGKVNTGIQTTIKESPGRFLAYNNGLSLTAKNVAVRNLNDAGQCQIDKITELQIVN
jgi:AIPR protein